MMVLPPLRVGSTALLAAFIVVVLLLPLVPWGAISAEDAPLAEEEPVVVMDPTATHVPVQPQLVATDPPPAEPQPPSPPPTPTPLATQPPPATEPSAQTEPPVMTETEPVGPTEGEPSAVTTEAPVEPNATEAPVEETPEPTLWDGSPEASADGDPDEISEVSLLALPPTGGGLLTLNGQTGLVYLNTSTALNFHVPDIANLADLFPVSGGYAMSTTITEYYEQWGCDRGGFRYHRHFGPYPSYTWDMTLPPRPAGLYSFQANVYVSDLNGNQLALGRTQCIDVAVSSSSGTPFLLVNGSAGPVLTDDAMQLTFSAGNLPAEATRHQLIRSTSPDCSGPSLMANFGPGVVVSHTTYDSVPGIRWYQVRSHNANGFPLATTPCVQVDLRTAVATLHVNSEQVEVSAIEGQSANLFATGLPPGQTANLIYYPAAGCAGPSFIDPTSPYTVSELGRVDTTFTLYASGRESISVRFRTATRETNCVSIRFLPNESELLVNGSLGPVSVVPGDELHLVASGLPPGVGAYPAFGCDQSDAPDDLPGTVRQDGTIEFFLSDGFPEDAFSVQVRLEPPSTAATNCVFVQFFDVEVDPALTINGSSQATVLVNEAYSIAGTGLPPLTRVTLARYDDSADCSGDETSLETETTEAGTLETTGSRSQSGTWSYRLLTPRGDSNCVAVQAVGEPVLTVNGSSGPLSVMVGTTLNLEVSGWPTGAETGLLREISLGEFCESPAWSLFPVGPAGPDGTAAHAIPTQDSMIGMRSYRIAGEFDVGGSTIALETNCVTVTVEGWSPLVTVNGSAGPLEVTTTMPLTVEVSNLPETAYQARLYPGRTGSDCSGVPLSSNLHQREPGQDVISVGLPPLPNPLDVPFAYSFNAQIHYRSDTGEERLLWSNCVLVIVDDDTVIVDPPTEPATEEPTEPSTEEPTEPATEHPTDVPTDPVTEEPTDVPTDPVTAEPTDPVTGEPTDPPTEQPSEPATEEPTVPATVSPTGGSNGSPPPAGGADGGGVATEGLQPGQLAVTGEPAVSRLPVTGATGGADRSAFGLLVLAAIMFGAAGSLVSRGGRRM